MAAVVNDSSVMYDTYKGNGFSADSSKAATTLPPAANRQPSAIPPPTGNRQPSTSIRQPPTVNRKHHSVNYPSAGHKKIREVSLKISRKIVFLDADYDGHGHRNSVCIFRKRRHGRKTELCTDGREKASFRFSRIRTLVTRRSRLCIIRAGCGEQATTRTLSGCGLLS